MAGTPIPDGYHSVTPYLVVNDAGALMSFLRDAFDAVEIERMLADDGSVRHGEVRIGDSVVMLGQARGESKAHPSTLYLYVGDADAVYGRALQAGARSLRELRNEAYGDRTGGVEDPAGNRWYIATRLSDTGGSQ